MTVPTTTAPAAKAALVAGITAAVADTTVAIIDGLPTPGQADDIVSVGDVTWSNDLFALVGGVQNAGAMEEIYTVDVVIQSFAGGDDFATVFARAAALLAAVHTYVRNNVTLGGIVNQALIGNARSEAKWAAGHEGPTVVITSAVGVHAVL